MARPPKDGITRDKIIKTRVSETEDRHIEELAEYLGIPKSVFIRNLLIVGLREARIYKALGLLDLAKGIQKTSESVKRFVEIREQHYFKNTPQTS
jgi:Zn-dependent peptidase ImmA (M78 family)